MRKVLVTGGAGFIGANFIHYLRAHYDYHIVNLDKLTYAGNPANLSELKDAEGYSFIQGDICDPEVVDRVMEGVWAVVNLAAETHVDRSLIDATVFIETDVMGAYVLLEAARRHAVERVLYVSTDEVYGPRLPESPAIESDVLQPSNPYAASKAGGEQMSMAYYRTYGLPVVVTRSANNIGPYQHPEKAVPLWVTNALNDEPLPVYGEGLQVRDRLYAEDNCAALDLLLHKGEPGEAYNIGSQNERTNLEVAETILSLLGKPRSLIRFVHDRLNHDDRYCLDTSKLRRLGWAPRYDYDAAMTKTVTWYRDHRDWWEPIKAGIFAEYFQKQYDKGLAESRGV